MEDDGEHEVAALREALRIQSLAVEKLRAELEQERQAASSGADEALAMILRLQAEKAADRMEAEQFRRIAEEKIRHNEDSLAFLKAVVFHQEMEINSLNWQLKACKNKMLSISMNDPYAWGMPRAQVSLPAIRLEELCSELEFVGEETRPARTMSDLAEVTGRETGRLRSNVRYQAPSKLYRSASHRLCRAPGYEAQGDMCSGSVQDKFEVPESVAVRLPARTSRGGSSDMVSEDENPRNVSNCTDHKKIAAFETDIQQIKGGLRNLESEFGRMRECSMSTGSTQARLLAEISEKLVVIQNHVQQQTQQDFRGEASSSSVRKGGSGEDKSSKGRRRHPQSELLMNHLIEGMLYISL